MPVAPQPKVECHNKIMKNFKQFLKEYKDSIWSVDYGNHPLFAQPDQSQEPHGGGTVHFGGPFTGYNWPPYYPPGPKPDPNSDKYYQNKELYYKDLADWKIKNAMHEAYKSICPSPTGCGNIFHYPQPLITPPPPGMQFYIGQDGRIFEWTENDTTGTWGWRQISG